MKKLFKSSGQWPFWDKTIKVLSTVGTVIALFLIVCQIHRMGEQNKAIWYSMRPDIYIHPISDKDIKGGSLDSNLAILGEGEGFYNIFYKIKNVGKSPALLDTVVDEYIWRKRLIRNTLAPDGRCLPQGVENIDNIGIYLGKHTPNYFHIYYTYKWDNAEKAHETFRYHKHYVAEYKDDSWSFHLIVPDTFVAHVNAIPDSLRFEIKDHDLIPLDRRK